LNVLVLSNFAAARAGRHLDALRAALPESDRVRHHLTRRGAELDALVAHDRWRPGDLLVINGGDGSVQHTLTRLLAHCPPERLPRVACLPGGTTNMTAYDINRQRRFRSCLDTLAGSLDGGDTVARRLVQVNGQDSGAGAVCGFFFGLGTIVQGIEYFHARVRPRGGGHELGTGVAVLRTAWGMARKQPPFAEPMAVAVDGAPWSVRLLLATTLDRLLLGARPFWGNGTGMLKATAVEARAPGFLRRLPRLLRGRADAGMTPEQGWHSSRTDALELAFDGPFTLDGELFRNRGATMRVSTTAEIRFIPL
jgi:diacylglycerol kinase (ATP)